MSNSKKNLPKWRVKAMYLGLQIGFNTGKFVQNLEVSDEVAAQLLSKFKKPENVFDIYPNHLKGKHIDNFIDKHLPKKGNSSQSKSQDEEE